MKVRCIDASKLPTGEDFYLTLGEVYEVIKQDKRSYKIIANNGRQVLYNKERFEIVEEDNKMQEKTFREVIADIKEGEVWESKTGKKVHLKRDKLFIDFNHEVTISGTVLPLNEVLTLQKKQYTFDEAFKAYEEGKEIESCYTGTKYKFEKLIYFYKRKNVEDWQLHGEMQLNEIRSKWYINN